MYISSNQFVQSAVLQLPRSRQRTLMNTLVLVNQSNLLVYIGTTSDTKYGGALLTFSNSLGFFMFRMKRLTCEKF